MDNTQNTPLNPSQIKQRSVFLKILKFLAILILEIIASKPSSRRPTLLEQAIGEKIPLSDQYYIPDDQNY
jgi:hypothetical protein